MRESEDKGKYQVENQQLVQGQVVGEGNIVHNYYGQPLPPSTSRPSAQESESDSSSIFGPALLILIVAIMAVAIFVLVVLLHP